MTVIECQNKAIECRCPNQKCKHKLGSADAIGKIFLWCKYCKKEVTFTIINEPDCLRVTAFIENNKINEKTVNITGNSRNA